MKTINVTFTSKEFEKLSKIKNDLSWRDFILKHLKGGKRNGNNKDSKR